MDALDPTAEAKYSENSITFFCFLLTKTVQLEAGFGVAEKVTKKKWLYL